MATATQLLANANYRAKAYDRISIDVKKGKRDAYNAAAKNLDLSLAMLIQLGTEEFIQNHAGKDQTANQLTTAITSTEEKPGETLSREEKKLLEDFRQLPVDSQKLVHGVIRAIIGAQAESD